MMDTHFSKCDIIDYFKKTPVTWEKRRDGGYNKVMVMVMVVIMVVVGT